MSEHDGVIVVDGIEIPYKILKFQPYSPEMDALIESDRDRIAGVEH